MGIDKKINAVVELVDQINLDKEYQTNSIIALLNLDKKLPTPWVLDREDIKNQLRTILLETSDKAEWFSNYLKSIISIQSVWKTHPEKKIFSNLTVTPELFKGEGPKKQYEAIKKLLSNLEPDERTKVYTKMVDFTLQDKDQEYLSINKYNEFLWYTKESQKKIASYRFKIKVLENNPEIQFKSEKEQNEFIEKQKNNALGLIWNVRDFHSDVIEDLTHSGLPLEIAMLWSAYFQTDKKWLDRIKSDIMSLWDKEELDEISMLFDIIPSDEWDACKIALFSASLEEDEYTEKSLKVIDIDKEKFSYKEYVKDKEWVKDKELVERPSLPINPVLFDAKISQWVIGFWEKEFKELFSGFYMSIVKKITDKLDVKAPDSFDLVSVNAKEMDKNQEAWKKLYSFLLNRRWNGWEYKEKLKDLWVIMKDLVSDLRLFEPGMLYSYKRSWFKKPLQWRNKYDWFFQDKWGFWHANLCYFQNEKNENSFQLAVSDELWMTDITYLIIQMSHYLSHWTILNKHQLYQLIFREYIKDQNKWEAVHDITIFKEQYEKLIEKVVYPLSTEWRNDWVEPESTLLAWSAGTWKSQCLLNLLLKDSFEFEWKSYDINAMVISLQVWELLYVMNKDKSMMNSIVQKTNLPLVIIVEDIDTYMQEWRSSWWDPFSQALTTLMTWVWSDKIKLLCSTNHWRQFSPRLIRPDRIENIVTFSLPLSPKITNSVIEFHAKENKLLPFEISLIKEFIPKMKYFSTSYITKFVKLVAAKKAFYGSIKKKKKIDKELVTEIFNAIPIPLKEIQNNEKDLQLREENLKDKNKSSRTIWYKWENK